MAATRLDPYAETKISLFGASTIQFYNYCDVSYRTPCLTPKLTVPQTFWKKDNWALKSAVCLAMSIDIAHLLFLLLPTYKNLESDFGNFAALEVNSV